MMSLSKMVSSWIHITALLTCMCTVLALIRSLCNKATSSPYYSDTLLYHYLPTGSVLDQSHHSEDGHTSYLELCSLVSSTLTDRYSMCLVAPLVSRILGVCDNEIFIIVIMYFIIMIITILAQILIRCL